MGAMGWGPQLDLGEPVRRERIHATALDGREDALGEPDWRADLHRVGGKLTCGGSNELSLMELGRARAH